MVNAPTSGQKPSDCEDMAQGGPGQVLLLARADDDHKVGLVLDLQAGHFGNCDAKTQPQFDTRNVSKGPLCKLPKTSLARGARWDTQISRRTMATDLHLTAVPRPSRMNFGDM